MKKAIRRFLGLPPERVLAVRTEDPLYEHQKRAFRSVCDGVERDLSDTAQLLALKLKDQP